jgi:hypothetical protein
LTVTCTEVVPDVLQVGNEAVLLPALVVERNIRETLPLVGEGVVVTEPNTSM